MYSRSLNILSSRNTFIDYNRHFILYFYQEEEWEAVGVIDYPFYDDHFSIQSERFLHGKTLNMLGKKLGGVDGRSLQLVGLGMYDKFPQAMKLLHDWMSDTDGAIVVQDVVSLHV